MTSASFEQARVVIHRLRELTADRFIEWESDTPCQAESKAWVGGHDTPTACEVDRFYGFGIGYEHLYNIGHKSFERLPLEFAVEGGRRGLWPEAFLQHYQLRGLIWEEDLYRSAVMNEMMFRWALAGLLCTP
ncbi:MAG: hypothetical protein ABSF26_27410 [Thermoguttaceae bacterium]|jgi:hypothetical protein